MRHSHREPDPKLLNDPGYRLTQYRMNVSTVLIDALRLRFRSAPFEQPEPTSVQWKNIYKTTDLLASVSKGTTELILACKDVSLQRIIKVFTALKVNLNVTMCPFEQLHR